MTEATQKRRWITFSLRIIFVIVGLAAAISWFCFSGLPWWQSHREQMVFEESVMQLKAGMRFGTAQRLLQSKIAILREIGIGTTATGEPVLFGICSCRDACYCICYVMPHVINGASSNLPCIRIEAYRLPPVPANYQSRVGLKEDPVINYIWDFDKILSGTLTAPPELHYELIYSDPPMVAPTIDN